MKYELTEDEMNELAPEIEYVPLTVDRIPAKAGFDAIAKGDDAAIYGALREAAKLAETLDTTARLLLRERLIKILGEKGIKSAAKVVDAALPKAANRTAESQGSSLTFDEVIPWETPVDISQILEEIRASLNRFLILPPYADIALALWVMHTWVFEHFDFTLYILIHSPAPECGKSRVLDVLHSIVPRPAKGSSFSAPVLFRTVEKFKPTLLIDEGDAFLESEELRGVMNDGYSRSSKVYRCQGDDNDVRGFSAYCPKAIAKIGKLTGKWATVTSRSVSIPMRRKLREEKVERFKFKKWHSEAESIRRKLARFAADYAHTLTASEPHLPEELGDRQQESWIPLLAIADIAGREWPELVRTAAVALCSQGFKTEDSTLSELLLGDIRNIFAERATDQMLDAERISSKDLCDELIKIEARPWAEFGKKEKPITPTQLARLLKAYGVESRQQKISGTNRNGYAKGDFVDAWKRYLDQGTIQKQPDSDTSKLYRIYQTDSKEDKPDFETLPEDIGRVTETAPNHNGMNAVDTVESRNGENRAYVKGIPHALPFPETVSKPESTDNWMSETSKRLKAIRQMRAVEQGVL